MSSWGCRVCSACGYDLDSDYYSRNQWSKGVGYSRCRTCVQEGIQSDEDGFSTARTNKATTRCTIDKSSVFADGSCRHVYLGTYTGGDRTGQMCVAKYFHDEFEHLEEDYFERDMNAVQKTLKIVTQWNQNDFISKIIRVNVPQVWQDSRSGSKFLLEPYIEDYQKFNSNSGWVTNGRTFWGRVMQALSHYSYHVSGGQFLLCDLQGGVNHVGAIISDPVIMSHNKRFGVTDLGRQGIINFFHHHRCNKYCQPEWTRPKYTCAYFERRQGTTMIRADYYDDDDDDD
eukprot:gene23339-gene18514